MCKIIPTFIFKCKLFEPPTSQLSLGSESERLGREGSLKRRRSEELKKASLWIQDLMTTGPNPARLLFISVSKYNHPKPTSRKVLRCFRFLLLLGGSEKPKAQNGGTKPKLSFAQRDGLSDRPQVSEKYFRPTEVETLLGDPAKARAKLGWPLASEAKRSSQKAEFLGSMLLGGVGLPALRKPTGFGLPTGCARF